MKPTDFEARLSRAVREKGYVMPELHVLSVPVTPVPRHDFFGKKPLSQAEEWAKRCLRGTYSVKNVGMSFVYCISGHTIEKYLSKVAIEKSENQDVHLAVLKVLPVVISNAIRAEIHPDYPKDENGDRRPENGHNDNVLIHRLYGVVSVNDMLARVKITLKEFKDDNVVNIPYSYEVTKIEMLDIKPSTSLTSTPPITINKAEHTKVQKKSELPKIDLAVLLRGVEKSYEPKKLLEESLRESCRAWLLVRMGNTKVNPNQNRKKGRGI